jgi:pimeloyl-ACP methyl ester carboxylesterase
VLTTSVDGLSWGSLRGQLYAQLYPQNIRSMTLDGIVDHSQDITSFLSTEGQGYNLVQRRLLEWMSTNTSSALHGRDVVTLYHDLLKRASDDPIPAPNPPISVCGSANGCWPNVTSEDIRNAIFNPTNTPTNAVYYSLALKEAYDNNNGSLLAQAIPVMEIGAGQSNLAIACTDWAVPQLSWEQFLPTQWMGAAFSQDGQGPLATREWAIGCQKWPVRNPRVNPPAPLYVRNPSAPILLVNALWDPATPFDAAVKTSMRIEKSVLVARYGEGHGSLFSEPTREVLYKYFHDVQPPKNRLIQGLYWPEETDFEILGFDKTAAQ